MLADEVQSIPRTRPGDSCLTIVMTPAGRLLLRSPAKDDSAVQLMR